MESSARPRPPEPGGYKCAAENDGCQAEENQGVNRAEEKGNKVVHLNSISLSAAKPQPKEITPPSPPPRGGGLALWSIEVTPQGKGGGMLFCLIKFKDLQNSSIEGTEPTRKNKKNRFWTRMNKDKNA